MSKTVRLTEGERRMVVVRTQEDEMASCSWKSRVSVVQDEYLEF